MSDHRRSDRCETANTPRASEVVLRIRLFGTLELFSNEQRLQPFPTYKARSLFSYLVVHRGRVHAREVLAGKFWGDRPDAISRKCLRTELWRIRQVLGSKPTGHELLSVCADAIGFRASEHCWIDIADFEGKVRDLQKRQARDLTAAERDRLSEAVELYRGELLEELYDEWCLYERERLRLMNLRTLNQLLNYSLLRDELAMALEFGERLLLLDPLFEHVHRSLMLIHYRMGNRAAALRQYQNCVRLLKNEMDVEPMDETRVLAERIRTEDSVVRESVVPEASAAEAERWTRQRRRSVREHLAAADRYVERAHRQLRLGLKSVRDPPAEAP